jgi:hypothetical protein
MNKKYFLFIVFIFSILISFLIHKIQCQKFIERKEFGLYDEYVLYNGDYWSEYRIGDLYTFGQFIACGKKNPGCKDDKYHVKQFPLSIAYFYHMYNPTNKKENEEAMRKAIIRVSQDNNISFHDNVLHLRVGDVMLFNTHQQNKYSQINNEQWWDDYINWCKVNKQKSVLILAGSHNVKLKKNWKPSFEFIHKIKTLLEKHRINVDLRIGQSPDIDIITAFSAKYFASTGGTYGKLMKKLAGTNNVNVYKSDSFSPQHIALCFCVRNCEPHLKGVFRNIDKLRERLNKTKITCIFVYDNCTDNSGKLLLSYKQNNENVHVEHIENTHSYRTCRIAKARNKCLDILYDLQDVKYHLMIDSDDKGSSKWNTDLIIKYLQDYDGDWDCMSFNRKNYYDKWALLFDDFKHHCWGFVNQKDCFRVINVMETEIVKKLKNSQSDSIEVMSAFNGFAIYKTKRFVGFNYDGLNKNFLKFFSDEERYILENVLSTKYGIYTKCLTDVGKQCCEHLHYHLSAHKQGRKIKISKYNIC